MEIRTFLIPASKRSLVEDKVFKMNKRGSKLKLDPIVLSWGTPKMNDVAAGKPTTLVIPVSVTGPLNISYSGWEFAATIQHLPDSENIIYGIFDISKIPAKYKNAKSDCEHCQVYRKRNDTYIVHNQTTNHFCQVGSSCIKDFLGGDSPDDLLNKVNFISESLYFFKGMEATDALNRQDTFFSLEEVLSYASAQIRLFGWMPKSKAYEARVTSTAEIVYDKFLNSENTLLTDQDLTKAKYAVSWAEGLTDDQVNNSSYLYNIRAIARSGLINHKAIGFAVSIVPAFDRACQERKPSEHVGSVGSRQDFNLLFDKKYSYQTQYGMMYKYIFHDDSGNVLCWSTNFFKEFNTGTHYLVNGLVKSHTEYKNIKQTEITRCRIIN